MTIKEVNEQIINIDNEEGILQYKLHGNISAWLVIRYTVYLRLLQKNVLKQNNKALDKSSIIQKITDRIAHRKHLTDCKKNSPLNKKAHYDCLNFYQSSAVVQKNGAYESRITGFVDTIDGLKTLNIIQSNNNRFKKKYTGDYCYLDELLFHSNSPPNEPANGLVEQLGLFVKVLECKIADKLAADDYKEIKYALQNISSSLFFFKKSIAEIFLATQPKLVLVEDGNLGYWMQTAIIKTAHEMNIKTAEVQHGALDIGFHYGKKLLDNYEFKTHKTNYCLTFGDYFTNLIQSSSINKSIGYYYLESQSANQVKVKKDDESKTILFISQHRYTYNLIPILYDALKKEKQKLSVVVKLHPIEDLKASHYELLKQLLGKQIKFEHESDIYKLIAKADYIIGSYSTVLFESAYFGKNPLIYKNEVSDQIIPADLGLRFSNSNELSSCMQKNEDAQLSENKIKYFWAKDCKKNFVTFLNEIFVG